MEFIVRDFQSIEEAKISVKGLTLLLGQTSSGKSAFTRAVSAACQNRFKQGQVRDGQDQAVIKIHAEESPDVLTVIRPYGGSIKMKLGQFEYSKVARTVPEPIQKYLNLSSIEVGNDSYSLNFHPQFQKPLLLEFSNKKLMDILSASKELDRLNELKEATQDAVTKNKGALRSVDSIISSVKTKLSTIKEERQKKEPLISKLRADLQTYESLQDTQISLKSLHTLVDESSKIESRLSRLSNLATLAQNALKLQKTTSELFTLHSITIENTTLTKRLSLLEQLKSVASYDPTPLTKLVTLKSYLFSLDETSTSILNLSNKIDVINNLALLTNKHNQLEENLAKLGQLKAAIDLIPTIDETKVNLAKSLVSYTPLLDKLRSRISYLSVLKTTIKNQQDLSNRITELEKITVNHICPICGNNMNINHQH